VVKGVVRKGQLGIKVETKNSKKEKKDKRSGSSEGGGDEKGRFQTFAERV